MHVRTAVLALAATSAVATSSPNTPPQGATEPRADLHDAARQSAAERLSEWETRAGWKLLFDGIDASAWSTALAPTRVDHGWLVAPFEASLAWSGSLRDFELEFSTRNAREAAPPEHELAARDRVDGFVRVVGRAGKVEVWDGAIHFDPLDVPSHSRVTLGPVAVWIDELSQRWHVGLRATDRASAFAGIRARELDALPRPSNALFDGKTLAGWREVGDATWTVEDGQLVGAVGGGKQSFLVTEKEYADFVLDVDVRNELPGNSGVQVRSHQDAKGVVFGNQIEIDPSARAWSGGLYDEGRRGWIADLAKDSAARAAFKPGEWNHYRIECVGPHVRTWVNGTRCVDALDPLDDAGFIGLQVHSGKDTKVRFANFELRELGASPWRSLELAPSAPEGGGTALTDVASGRWSVKDELDDAVLRIVRAPGVGAAYTLRARSSSPSGGSDWSTLDETASSRGWSFEFPARTADAPPASAWYAVFAGTRVLVVDEKGGRHESHDLRVPSRGAFELRSTPGAPGPKGELTLDVRRAR